MQMTVHVQRSLFTSSGCQGCAQLAAGAQVVAPSCSTAS